MDSSHSSNIFDEASNKKSSSPKKELVVPSIPAVDISDEQVASLFEKAKKMRQEIDQKLQEVYDKTGMTRKEVENYMSNPKNFTVQEWQNIQIGRKDWEGRLYGILGQEYKEKRAKIVQDQSSKERKGKTLGARKNWIPVR